MWLVGARQSGLVLFWHGAAGIGHGKAVGVRLGKVLSGVVWCGESGPVSARQSCLGTFRCGAVMFGEVRQSRRCKLWRGEFWRVWSGLGSQGFAGHVTVERGEAGQSTVGKGSRGLARRGEVQYVAANRGMAGHGSLG